MALPFTGGKLRSQQRYCFLFSKHLLLTTRTIRKPNNVYKLVKVRVIGGRIKEEDGGGIEEREGVDGRRGERKEVWGGGGRGGQEREGQGDGIADRCKIVRWARW